MMKRFYLNILIPSFFLLSFLISCSEETCVDEIGNFECPTIYAVSDKFAFVSADEALKTADAFFCMSTNSSTRSDFSVPKGSQKLSVIGKDNKPQLYIVNYEGGGFVVIGSTRNYYPILAYSDKNNFDLSIGIQGLNDWLQETESAVELSDQFSDSLKLAMQNLWLMFETSNNNVKSSLRRAMLKSPSLGEMACWDRCDELAIHYGDGWYFAPLSQAQSAFVGAGHGGMYETLCYSAEFNHSPINMSVVGWKIGNSTNEVGPLLTTTWSQGLPYNYFCDGNPAGCAAIALSQVLNYYQYPDFFSWNGLTFDWDDINSTDFYKAALVRCVGSAVGTSYHSSFSFATPSGVENGIESFSYGVTVGDHNFEKVTREVMSYERPVIMLGNDDNLSFLPSPLSYIGNSHYWVCDGGRTVSNNIFCFFTEWQPYGNGVFEGGWNSLENPYILEGVRYLYFHMNWGWGGSNDGWYVFNDVNTGNSNFEHSRKDFYISEP